MQAATVKGVFFPPWRFEPAHLAGGLELEQGAQSADVTRLFIRQGMSVILLGLGLGLLGAFALTRVMKGLLFGVGTTDLLTFACVALLLTLIALVACYLPARHGDASGALGRGRGGVAG